MVTKKITILDLAYIRKIKSGKKIRMVNALCFCGEEFVASLDSVNGGLTKSCGCLIALKQLERYNEESYHKSKHPLYRIWIEMKARCFNESNISFPNYGGRGITVFDEWVNNYPLFFKWAKLNKYKKGLHLDRINNDGGYHPDNCRFITPYENQHNRKAQCIEVTYNGESKSLNDWGIEYKINPSTLRDRLRSGMSVEMALKKPVKKKVLNYK